MFPPCNSSVHHSLCCFSLPPSVSWLDLGAAGWCSMEPASFSWARPSRSTMKFYFSLCDLAGTGYDVIIHEIRRQQAGLAAGAGSTTVVLIWDSCRWCTWMCLGTDTQVCVILHQPGEVLRGCSDLLVWFVCTSPVWKRWECINLCAACVCPWLTGLT